VKSVILTTANSKEDSYSPLPNDQNQGYNGNSGDYLLPAGESGLLARFSLQLFKLYFSASIASKLQEVLNSLNSLLEFNYITSFLFPGILKMFWFL